MILEDLKKEIPYKWRVQSANQYGASCVAYIDSRDVQDLLDDVVGAHNWQCKFEEHKNNMFCSIGINIEQRRNDESVDSLGWVWKSDCGTESNVEKQKGEASDAFKRAAVMWGVGRFLYSKKIIKLKTKEENKKWIPINENGSRIWDVTKHINSSLLKQPTKVYITETQSQQAIDKGIDTIKKTLAYYDGKTVRDNKIYCMKATFKTILEAALTV